MMLLALLAAVVIIAAPAAAQRFNAESFTLGNGLQVVVVPNHRVPAVTQMVWYKIGAADDPRGKSGIAHFLEHLMFKGTRGQPAGRLHRADRAQWRARQRIHRRRITPPITRPSRATGWIW